jgi:CIC family chloride channel protein
LPSLEEQREQIVLRVEDAMKPAPTPVLDAQDSVGQAMHRVQDLSGIFLVRMNPSGWSSVTSDVLKRLVGEGKGEMTLGSTLPTRNLPYLHPDVTLEAALRHVYQVPLVPVVHRADFRRLEGVISREDVLEKYKRMEED